MRISRDTWIFVGLFVLLVIVGIHMAAPPKFQKSDWSTTYNPSPNGVRAFYTLVSQRLGYDAQRLFRPYTEMENGAKTLIIVQPLSRVPIAIDEEAALAKWISRGGTLIVMSDGLVNIPAQFQRSKQLGKGRIIAMNSRKPITNHGMRNPNNAMKLLEMLDISAGKKGLVLFDEYHHGLHEESFSMGIEMSRNVKISLAILALAALLLCFSRARRFGAVRRLPKSETVRPGVEFVDAIAGLYSKAKATDVAADILSTSFRRSLCAKLGIASDSTVDDITHALESQNQNDIAADVKYILRPARKPSETELVEIAKMISNLETSLRI